MVAAVRNSVPDEIVCRTVLSPEITVITIRCDDLRRVGPFVTALLRDFKCLAIADHSTVAAALRCHEALVMRNKQNTD